MTNTIHDIKENPYSFTSEQGTFNNRFEIVYLNGKKIENENYPKEFLSNALYNLKNYSKFPHLMKIRNGKLIDKSINTIFFSIKNQKQSKEKLLKEIEFFFE